MTVQARIDEIKCQYEKCPECGKRAVDMAMAYVPSDQFFGVWDDDGVSIYGDEPAPSNETIALYAHICFECGKLIDLGIEDPRELDNATKREQAAQAENARLREAISKALSLCAEAQTRYIYDSGIWVEFAKIGMALERDGQPQPEPVPPQLATTETARGVWVSEE